MGILGLVDLFEFLGSDPEYKKIAPLQQLDLMTTTYMSDKGFSYLVELMGVGRVGGRQGHEDLGLCNLIFTNSFFVEKMFLS